MFSDKYFLLIRKLLLTPHQCPFGDHIKLTDLDWKSLTEIMVNNKILALFYHFQICGSCSKFVINKKLINIDLIYYSGLLKYLQYKRLKQKICKLLKGNQMKIVLLKDNDLDKLAIFYPKFFYPLKYDIDLWGRKNELKNLQKKLREWNYLGKQVKLEGKYPIDQYEFTQSTKRGVGIEYRYCLITCRRYKKPPIISDILREAIDKKCWFHTLKTKGGFRRLESSHAFLSRLLIFYFDDACQGIKHLYDLWLFINKEKLDWKDLLYSAEKWNLTNFVVFISSLALSVFGNQNSNLPAIIHQPSIKVKIARSLFWNYTLLYKPFSPSIDLFYKKSAWRERYLFLSITAILWQTSFWNVILFFFNLKVLFFLIYFLISFSVKYIYYILLLFFKSILLKN